jgi:hypothetical protein
VLYWALYSSAPMPNRSRDLVFLVQALQTLAMCVHYTFIGDEFDIIFLIQEYILLVQYSLVFYYFWIQLSEYLERLRMAKKPLVWINCVMLVGFIVYAGVSIGLNQPVYACDSGIWLYLHICGVFLSIAFLLLGLHASRILNRLRSNDTVLINSQKVVHFWYILNRVIITSMAVASIVNMAESILFIDKDNSSCYNSYSDSQTANLVIFVIIRVLSHYLFISSCLYIFRTEKNMKNYSEVNSESSGSFMRRVDGHSAENSWYVTMPVIPGSQN